MMRGLFCFMVKKLVDIYVIYYRMCHLLASIQLRYMYNQQIKLM